MHVKSLLFFEMYSNFLHNSFTLVQEIKNYLRKLLPKIMIAYRINVNAATFIIRKDSFPLRAKKGVFFFANGFFCFCLKFNRAAISWYSGSRLRQLFVLCISSSVAFLQVRRIRIEMK